MTATGTVLYFPHVVRTDHSPGDRVRQLHGRLDGRRRVHRLRPAVGHRPVSEARRQTLRSHHPRDRLPQPRGSRIRRTATRCADRRGAGHASRGRARVGRGRSRDGRSRSAKCGSSSSPRPGIAPSSSASWSPTRAVARSHGACSPQTSCWSATSRGRTSHSPVKKGLACSSTRRSRRSRASRTSSRSPGARQRVHREAVFQVQVVHDHRGYERAHPARQFGDRDAFVAFMNADQPVRPANLENIVAINQGARDASDARTAPTLPADAVDAALDAGGIVIDLRSQVAFGGAHLPGSLEHPVVGSEFEQGR